MKYIMRKLDFVVPASYDGCKVEHFLRQAQGMSLRVIKDLKKTSYGLTCNGVHTRTIDLVHTGDVVSVVLEDHPQEYLLSALKVPILYEDDDVMVYNKPANMPCHQAKTHQQDTLANVFAAHCAAQGLPLSFRAINRLDRNTTGAVVVAKNAHAAAQLGGKIDKTYLALVCGVFPYRQGVIDAPIGRLADDYINRIVTPNGQFARTGFTLLGQGREYSYLRCHLYTGRTHQIRVHFSWLGYPLAGDDLYGTDSRLLSRQALHCGEVRFRHPVSGQVIEIQAPLHQDMQTALELAEILP